MPRKLPKAQTGEAIGAHPVLLNGRWPWFKPTSLQTGEKGGDSPGKASSNVAGEAVKFLVNL